MKRTASSSFLGLVTVCIWLAGPGLVSAQQPRDALETLRADLKANRNALIAQQMSLTPEESQAFWPVYRQYRVEVEKVSDRLVELVLEYGDLYPNVPDQRAAAMLDKYSKMEGDLLKVKQKYLKKLVKVLPASKVFRFAQLDNRFDLGTRLALAASIPLLGQNQIPAGKLSP